MDWSWHITVGWICQGSDRRVCKNNYTIFLSEPSSESDPSWWARASASAIRFTRKAWWRASAASWRSVGSGIAARGCGEHRAVMLSNPDPIYRGIYRTYIQTPLRAKTVLRLVDQSWNPIWAFSASKINKPNHIRNRSRNRPISSTDWTSLVHGQGECLP